MEESFSLMSDFLSPQTSRLNTSTVSAVQTIKYGLMAKEKSAVQTFGSQKGKPVNTKLITNMKLAFSRRAKENDMRIRAKKERSERLKIDKKCLSKVQAMKKTRNLAREEQLKHTKKLRKMALEALAEKKRRGEKAASGRAERMKKRKGKIEETEEHTKKKKRRL